MEAFCQLLQQIFEDLSNNPSLEGKLLRLLPGWKLGFLSFFKILLDQGFPNLLVSKYHLGYLCNMWISLEIQQVQNGPSTP